MIRLSSNGKLEALAGKKRLNKHRSRSSHRSWKTLVHYLVVLIRVEDNDIIIIVIIGRSIIDDRRRLRQTICYCGHHCDGN